MKRLITIILLAIATTVHAQKDSTIEVAFRYDNIVVVVYSTQPHTEYIISYESYCKKIMKQSMMYLSKAMDINGQLDIEDQQAILNEIKRIVKSASIQ